MMYLGDFAPLSTVYASFTTAGANGARIAPSGAFTTADFRIYKNGSTTERSSMAGVTVSSTFDALTGVCTVAIDTSDNTDAGFYASGAEYALVLYPASITVDSQAPSAVIAQWSMARKASGIAHQGTAQAAAAGTITLSSTAVATDDYYKGDVVFIASGTGIGQSRYIVSYVGSTKVATITPNWTTTPDSTSYVMTFIGVSATADANVVAWSGTTVPTPDTAGYPKVTVKSGTGTGELSVAAGVVASSVSSVAANAITAAAIASGALTAAKFATDSIDANALAATAVTEMQSGLSTAAALVTAQTAITAIKTTTDKLTFTVANQVDANMLSVKNVALIGDGAATKFHV